MAFVFSAAAEYVAANYLFRVQARVEKAAAAHRAAAAAARAAAASVVGDGATRAVDVGEVEVLAAAKAGGGEQSVRAGIRSKVGKADYLLLRPDGTLRLLDEHLDVFSRWAFPPAYAIAIGVLFSELP